MLNAERLRQLLDYDPETGHLTWRETRGPKAKGSRAGSHCNKGYLVAGIEGRVYKAHRLAWLWMTGEWPKAQVDHRNTVKDDNRWDNLREATNLQNCNNRIHPNRTGFKGVSRQPNGRYVGKCNVGHKRYQKGGFATAKEAAQWAAWAREQHHGTFARHA